MIILNLACNGHRPTPPFINIDILHTQLLSGTEERQNLDKETNYIEHDLLKEVPFEDNSCEGVFISHFLEHLDAQQSVKLIQESLRVLKPNGLLMISVPDASYFKSVYYEDSKENSMNLFGEAIWDWCVDGKNMGPFKSFFDYALFYHEHKQVLTFDSLWCLMTKGGCTNVYRNIAVQDDIDHEVLRLMSREINRLKFSLVLWAVKEA